MGKVHYPYLQGKKNGRKVDKHRSIMEQTIGRTLGRFEFVHHINGNKRDNRIENLQLVNPKEHMQVHGRQKHPLTWTCEVCGSVFTPPATKRGGRKRICSLHCKHVLISRAERNPNTPYSRYRDDAYPSERRQRIE